MKIYAIKSVLEILALLILYIIARRQEKRITTIEYKKEDYHQGFKAGITFDRSPIIKESPFKDNTSDGSWKSKVTSEEQRMKSKLMKEKYEELLGFKPDAEENRMQDITDPLPLLKTKYAVLKGIKKQVAKKRVK